jgi:NADPH:quinone reductase
MRWDMKAIELIGYEDFDSIQVIEMEKPKPAANEVLLEVKAAAINFADLELTRGRYQVGRKLPFIMGFEAADIVVELGAQVINLKIGDKVT